MCITYHTNGIFSNIFRGKSPKKNDYFSRRAWKSSVFSLQSASPRARRMCRKGTEGDERLFFFVRSCPFLSVARWGCLGLVRTDGTFGTSGTCGTRLRLIKRIFSFVEPEGGSCTTKDTLKKSRGFKRAKLKSPKSGCFAPFELFTFRGERSVQILRRLFRRCGIGASRDGRAWHRMPWKDPFRCRDPPVLW